MNKNNNNNSNLFIVEYPNMFNALCRKDKKYSNKCVKLQFYTFTSKSNNDITITKRALH